MVAFSALRRSHYQVLRNVTVELCSFRPRRIPRNTSDFPRLRVTNRLAMEACWSHIHGSVRDNVTCPQQLCHKYQDTLSGETIPWADPSTSTEDEMGRPAVWTGIYPFLCSRWIVEIALGFEQIWRIEVLGISQDTPIILNDCRPFWDMETINGIIFRELMRQTHGGRSSPSPCLLRD